MALCVISFLVSAIDYNIHIPVEQKKFVSVPLKAGPLP